MPTPLGPAPTAPTSDAPETPPEKKAGDLTVNKILAGAAAAATSAILGSYLGAAGTVAGAALGSLVSTVATSLYQRSLDRTRETVIARIRPVRGPAVGDDAERARRAAAGGVAGADAPTVVAEPVPDVTVPMPRLSPENTAAAAAAPPGDRDTTVLRPAPPPGRSRRVVMAGLGLLVFLLGMLAVTGFELVRGSTLWGGEGDTSVGRVVAPVPSSDEGGEATQISPTPTTEPEATETVTPEQSAGSTAEPTAEPTESAVPTTEADSGPDDGTTAPGGAATPGPSATVMP